MEHNLFQKLTKRGMRVIRYTYTPILFWYLKGICTLYPSSQCLWKKNPSIVVIWNFSIRYHRYLPPQYLNIIVRAIIRSCQETVYKFSYYSTAEFGTAFDFFPMIRADVTISCLFSHTTAIARVPWLFYRLLPWQTHHPPSLTEVYLIFHPDPISWE